MNFTINELSNEWIKRYMKYTLNELNDKWINQWMN